MPGLMTPSSSSSESSLDDDILWDWWKNLQYENVSSESLAADGHTGLAEWVHQREVDVKYEEWLKTTSTDDLFIRNWWKQVLEQIALSEIQGIACRWRNVSAFNSPIAVRARKRRLTMAAERAERLRKEFYATAPAEGVDKRQLSDALMAWWKEVRPTARAHMIRVDKHTTAPAEADPRPWSSRKPTLDFVCPICGRSAEDLSEDGAEVGDFGCPVHGANVGLIEVECLPMEEVD